MKLCHLTHLDLDNTYRPFITVLPVTNPLLCYRSEREDNSLCWVARVLLTTLIDSLWVVLQRTDLSRGVGREGVWWFWRRMRRMVGGICRQKHVMVHKSYKWWEDKQGASFLTPVQRYWQQTFKGWLSACQVENIVYCSRESSLVLSTHIPTHTPVFFSKWFSYIVSF